MSRLLSSRAVLVTVVLAACQAAVVANAQTPGAPAAAARQVITSAEQLPRRVIKLDKSPAFLLTQFGLTGDNITDKSDRTPWYAGPTLMEHLETVPIDDVQTSGPFRLPVQWVNRPNLDFRGFAGLIASGTVRVGDPVRIVPSGKTSTVKTITNNGSSTQATRVGNFAIAH